MKKESIIGHNRPNIPTQGVGGASLPPKSPQSMGHTARLTPLQRYTCGYPVHMPMPPVRQANQPTPMGYYTASPVTQMATKMRRQTKTSIRRGPGCRQQKVSPRRHPRNHPLTQPPLSFEVVRRQRIYYDEPGYRAKQSKQQPGSTSVPNQ